MVLGREQQQQQQQQQQQGSWTQVWVRPASPPLSPPLSLSLPLLLVLLLPVLPGLCRASEQAGWPRCWGQADHGQTEVPSILSHDISAAQDDVTCGIDMAGDVWCAGGYPRPLVVPGDLTASAAARQVAVGWQFACVLLADASVRCFGSPNFNHGQTQVPQALGAVQQLSAGVNHVCAVLETGDITCWGSNWNNKSSPPSGLQASQVQVGPGHSCALLNSGSEQCWGGNLYGEATIPVELSGRVRQLSPGWHHSCAVLEDATASCWGRNVHGEADVPSDLGPVARISAGYLHTCALHSSGNVTCWGGNQYGESSVPAEIRHQGQAALQLSGGYQTSCVLLAAGPSTSMSRASTTTSSSTSRPSTSSTTSTTPLCLIDNMMSCSVPPGTYSVQGLPESRECSISAGVGESLIFINTSSCPPNRTHHSTTVVDTYTLEPVVAHALPWLDPSRRSVLCSCVSPRHGGASVGWKVPTLAPLHNQPGMGIFEPSINLCANASCQTSAAAAPPGAQRFHFRVASDDANDEIEVSNVTTCPGGDPEAPECTSLVRENCVVQPLLQLSFKRDGHQVFWSLLSFAWMESPAVHMFVQVRRCASASQCGICASGGGAPEGAGRRMQALTSSPQAPLRELEFNTSGDEPVLLVPFPRQSLPGSRAAGGGGSGSGIVPREIQVPLLSKGNVGGDALWRAALAGLWAEEPAAELTSIALVQQPDLQGSVRLMVSISIEVPVAHVQGQDRPQLDAATAALREQLERLGLAVAPSLSLTLTPTPTTTTTSTSKPEGFVSSSVWVGPSTWTVLAPLLGWRLSSAGVGIGVGRG